MTDTDPAPSRPPLKVDVSFDLDAYLSTWEHGARQTSMDEPPEETWTPHPYPFVEVLLDRVAAALAARAYRDSSYDLSTIRRKALDGLADKIDAAVEERVRVAVDDLDDRIAAALPAAIGRVAQHDDDRRDPDTVTLDDLVKARVEQLARHRVNNILDHTVLDRYLDRDTLRHAIAAALTTPDEGN